MHRDCWFFGPSGQVDRGFDYDRNSSGRLLEKVGAGGIGEGIFYAARFIMNLVFIINIFRSAKKYFSRDAFSKGGF